MVIQLIQHRTKDIQMWVGDKPINGKVNHTQNFGARPGAESDQFVAELTFSLVKPDNPDLLTAAVTKEAVFQVIGEATKEQVLLEAYHVLYTLAQEAIDQICFMGRVSFFKFPMMKSIPFDK